MKSIGNCRVMDFTWIFYLGLLLCFTRTNAEKITVRLVNGTDSSNGRVEVTKDNQKWGTVCDDSWSTEDATVVCRQLGFKWGVAFGGAKFGEGTGKIFLDDMYCEGNETNLSDCRKSNGWGNHNCEHSEDAGVACYHNTVRLLTQYPMSNRYGMVQVQGDYGWSDICDRGWDDVDAKVACKELGFVDGKAQCCSKLGKLFNESEGETNYIDYNCTGTEATLAKCSRRRRWSGCDIGNMSSVICYDTDRSLVNNTFDVRIQDGGNDWGRVEVRIAGVWGRVSALYFDNNAAAVVCKRAGFKDGKPYGAVSDGNMPMWITYLRCNGLEGNLDQCAYSTYGNPPEGYRTAYVICFNSGIEIRLSGGKANYGRVEIVSDGIVGTVCGDNWSDTEAAIVCRSLGYVDGREFLPVRSQMSSANVSMMNVLCSGSEGWLLSCQNSGWYNGKSVCNTANGVGWVVCDSEVRLSHGQHSVHSAHGIVEIYSNNFWTAMCNMGFTDVSALVVCKQQGFIYGKMLPAGAYGAVGVSIKKPALQCTGSENNINDCPSSNSMCASQSYAYASVACSNNQPVSQDISIYISDQYGPIQVEKSGVKGRICSTFWDDKDADVACRSLGGYLGGMAYIYPEKERVPFLISNIVCNGTETNLKNCIQNSGYCTDTTTAGAVCYTNRAPSAHIVAGGAFFGRIEIEYDTFRGTICDTQWTSDDANVACKQMGYKMGEKYSAIAASPNQVDVFLENPKCAGSEDSLFFCETNGWNQILNPDCKQHKNDVGAVCWNKVRLAEGVVKNDYIIGKLLLFDDSRKTWKIICNENFHQKEADVVCREFGYPRAKLLQSAAFNYDYEHHMLFKVTCQGNEPSLSTCEINDDDWCSDDTTDYVSVVCHKETHQQDNLFYIENDYYGLVIVERYGFNGTICPSGWDDKDANVLCKQKGFIGGKALGLEYDRDFGGDLVWLSNVTCNGDETSMSKCKYLADSSVKCPKSYTAAGVLCSRKTETVVRLMGGSRHYGRVEIGYDGVYGTICDDSWTTFDAQVLCRQLGFVDGIAHPDSKFGKGSGPVYFDGMRCGEDEHAIWACPNDGWNISRSSCKDHDDDASVFCYRQVTLRPGPQFGALQLWQRYTYRSVCAANFTDIEANVACKDMGYPYGKSLCCSAFGDLQTFMFIPYMKCSSSDFTSVNDCEINSNICGVDYASVVCSTEAPSGVYRLSLSEGNYGRVQVRYFGNQGYICPNGFDNNDAAVICRELGYVNGGHAMVNATYYTGDLVTDLRWLTKLNCNGNENYLSQCPDLNWGQISGCNNYGVASVVCYTSSDISQKIDMRITGTNKTQGSVEIRVNGTWGQVCGLQLTDNDASAVCRTKNFPHGQVIAMSASEPSVLPVHITSMNCTGKESNIFQCPMKGFNQEPNSNCYRGTYPATVRCLEKLRLIGSNLENYGRAELYINSKWVAICDNEFHDTDASVICKQLDFSTGIAQCCSSLGKSTSTNTWSIGITKMKCKGTETDVHNCSYETGQCSSGNYATVLCFKDQFIADHVKVGIFKNLFYGPINLMRHGMNGTVCRSGLGDKEARVMCKQMAFETGYALTTNQWPLQPVTAQSVNCLGTERDVNDCQISSFNSGANCYQENYRAGVICSRNLDDVRYRLSSTSGGISRAEIFINGKWGALCSTGFGDRNAEVFCKQLGYVTGRSSFNFATVADTPVWALDINCTGNETSFLQCPANWDFSGDAVCSSGENAGVRCFNYTRLIRGDYKTNGMIEVYKDDSWGTVCAHGFSKTNAEVACRELGYDHGINLCCAPYGYNLWPLSIANVNCTGNEKHLLDCPHTYTDGSDRCDSDDYASLACYDGAFNQVNYSLNIAGGGSNSGEVVINLLGIDGRICSDGWNDKAARVACRELGYVNGESYSHYKSSLQFLDYSGPYWTSGVNCTGNENRISDCSYVPFGEVKSCLAGHVAGVLCYDDQGISFRLGGGDNQYGRAEVKINGTWGTICGDYWDPREAAVFCRMLGYSTGDTHYVFKNKGTGPVWKTNFRCTGSESDLNDCAHEGWTTSEIDYCSTHQSDAGAFCYRTVKLGTAQGRLEKHGSVLYYMGNNKWGHVCDDGFTDKSARLVCQDLGFIDGKAICCSAYGSKTYSPVQNHTLKCYGSERNIGECARNETCLSGGYASVVCFNQTDIANGVMNDTAYQYELSNATHGSGSVEVYHYGMKGRICSTSWDDNDAQVLCKSKGYLNGIAYSHFPTGQGIADRVQGPFWLSEVNCTGSESSLTDCKKGERLNLGNCSSRYPAAVLCYNHSGIQYRIAGGNHFGRVEMSVGGVWGTVCGEFWDDNEAKVFCRQLGNSDGEAVSGGTYGPGTGPIWLSHLRCRGNEKVLHGCTHLGFGSELSDALSLNPLAVCSSHRNDAGVYCYKSIRLNLGYDSPMGGVEIHNGDKWHAVCDEGFDDTEARIVCKSLNSSFIDAHAIPNSGFGNISSEISISKLSCSGTESDIKLCNIVYSKVCPSGQYASVVCSTTQLQEQGLQFRISPDSLASDQHGIVEAQWNGIWGRICMQDWNEKSANVLCRSLGYAGGVSYLHIIKNKKPILLRNVKCTGDESDLSKCKYEKYGDTKNCTYSSNDAGVLCYNTTGVAYRLGVSGPPNNNTYGRVEIGLDGEWGSICSWSFDSREARVLCSGIGHHDGLVSFERQSTLPTLEHWFNALFCNGAEDTLLTCLNSGFQASFLQDMCETYGSKEAYATCYDEKVVPTKIRLQNGGKDTGRVEVYIQGPNAWGTVCDDFWNENNANVTCRMLGYDGGKARLRGAFGEGEGNIWFDNVECIGNETYLWDCKHRGINVHNCKHSEDAGVECYNSVVVTTKATTSTLSSTSVKQTTTTTSTEATTTTTVTSSSSSVKGSTSTVTSTSSSTTTESKTSQQTSSTSTPTSTTESTTPLVQNTPEKHTGSEKNIVPYVVIPIVLIIVLVVVIVGIIVWRTRRSKRDVPHERFHDDIAHSNADGSTGMSNQLFGIPDMASASGSDQLTFNENGSAKFTKQPADNVAFANPLYQMPKENTIEPVGDQNYIDTTYAQIKDDEGNVGISIQPTKKDSQA